jgi:signal transduction histidine kinase
VPAGRNHVPRENQVKILLVDDRAENLVALEALLGDLGANLVKAGSGPEALKQLLQDDFALVLLDVQMAGMDGFETAGLIRQREKTRRTPIIFITAIHTAEANISRGYSFGAADYLCKPVDPQALRSKVTAFVDLAKVTQELQGEVIRREQAERQVRRLNEELERRVEERTAALEAANRRKDAFLATLAHELRNPLAGISNALEVLHRAEAGTPTCERALAAARRQVRHQARMLDDLLEVARITRGTVDLHRERRDLGELVRHAAQDAQPALEGAGLTFSLSLPGEPVWVMADAMRLTQVIAHLLDNARRFTDAGGQVLVEVEGPESCSCSSSSSVVPPVSRTTTRTSTSTMGGESSTAVVRVRDTGRGIPVELLSDIFEPLVQAPRGHERAANGLGLGLALVRGMVELHGGRVSAASEGPGRGAEFTLSLPIVAPPPAAALTAGTAALARMEPLQILIVEDNQDGAETLRDLLELMGHQVEVASSGPAGLERARALRPHVAVLDIGLPEMDGYTLARRIRREKELGATRLIALTGYGQKADRHRSRAAGFDHHLVKPVDVGELYHLLGSLCEKHKDTKTQRHKGRKE